MLESLAALLTREPDYSRDADRWLRFDRSPMGRVQAKNTREVRALDNEIEASFRAFLRGAK
jgi:hypothetical protein